MIDCSASRPSQLEAADTGNGGYADPPIVVAGVHTLAVKSMILETKGQDSGDAGGGHYRIFQVPHINTKARWLAGSNAGISAAAASNAPVL